MFYHNLKDLTLAAMSWDSLSDLEKSNLFLLVRVYMSALNNPPKGVIGVCAITYAERQLVLAQEVTR